MQNCIKVDCSLLFKLQKISAYKNMITGQRSRSNVAQNLINSRVQPHIQSDSAKNNMCITHKAGTRVIYYISSYSLAIG